jgi:hypothetical protein
LKSKGVVIVIVVVVVLGQGQGGLWLWWWWWRWRWLLLGVMQEHGSYQIFENSCLLSKAGFIGWNMDVTVP